MKWIKTAPKPLGCYDCGLRYGGPGWIETHIPSEVWDKVSPTGNYGGVLCITCISRRLEILKMDEVPLWIITGPFASYPQDILHHDAYEAGRRHEREGFPATAREREIIDRMALVVPEAGKACDIGTAVDRVLARLSA